jgi:2-polyprenyl-6-methoxyphenol hydroxylase-like FAD-dependent oxidoreductase
MGWQARGLLRKDGRITGVTATTPDGSAEITADLTVGCDGRQATSTDAAHLYAVERGVPIDVLWFRVGRRPDDPENALGYINYGRALILINRNDYFQCGFIIAKGQFPFIRQQGLFEFRDSLGHLAPFLAGRTAEIDSWDKVKLLTVQINHLEKWTLPGLLCIGDAAHAMSPVGGIGINIALQDAVAAANILADPLRTGTLTDHHPKWVQTHRAQAVLRTQRIQAFAHRVLNKVLQNPRPLKPPLALRILTRIPGFQKLTGRFVGIGLQPEHIRTSPQSSHPLTSPPQSPPEQNASE